MTLAFLHRDAALEFDDWTASVRTYLKEQPEHIPLRPIITGYAADLDQLYGRICSQFEDLHGEEVDELNALIEQLQGPE